MNKTDKNEIMEQMLNVTNDKYGKSFKVEYFQPAIDETYTDILTLSDDGMLFNVYQNKKLISDDYLHVIVNKKIDRYVMDGLGQLPEGVSVYTNYLIAGVEGHSAEELMELDYPELLKNVSLMKTIVVVCSDTPLSERRDLLYSIYKGFVSLEPEYVDFEFLQVKQLTPDLEKMLKNLIALYDSDWSKHDPVLDVTAIFDKNLSDPQELLGR